MTTLLANFGEVTTAVTGSIATVVTAVVAQPLLLIPVALSFLGIAVGLVKKFM